MGQRHQIFIVARVTARDGVARYRCVGAYHHQWCYGRLPLKGARRFLTLVKQKDNGMIVQDELRAIQGQDPNADFPCPYSTFLLASAFCVDLEPDKCYGSGVSFGNSLLNAQMGSADGDNNDGITVFDITSPTDLSYCFVSIYGLEGAAVGVEEYVPLTAEQYARAYYPVPIEGWTYGNDEETEQAKLLEEDVQKTIDALRDERLMTLDVLAEAWPQEYKRPAARVPSTAEDAAPAPTLHGFPRLSDLSLGPAVEHSIRQDETEELEGLVWLPGKAASIRSILQRQNPFPDSGLSLLAQVIQHEAKSDKTNLNLSSLSLSDSQLVSLLASLDMADVEFLDLSHNTHVTKDGLCQILTTTKLRRLTLLDTSISNQQIYQMLAEETKLFPALEALVHPALLNVQDPPEYPNAFAFVGLSNQASCAVSLALCSPASIVQSLIDLLGSVANSPVHGLIGSSLVPQAAFACGVRDEGQPWGNRRVDCFPSLTYPPFKDPAWLFVARYGTFNQAAARYGFVRINAAAVEETPNFTIRDLKEFLKDMASEGRPLPSDNAVQKLEGIFAAWESKGAKFWTDKEFEPFMSKWSNM